MDQNEGLLTVPAVLTILVLWKRYGKAISKKKEKLSEKHGNFEKWRRRFCCFHASCCIVAVSSWCNQVCRLSICLKVIYVTPCSALSALLAYLNPLPSLFLLDRQRDLNTHSKNTLGRVVYVTEFQAFIVSLAQLRYFAYSFTSALSTPKQTGMYHY